MSKVMFALGPFIVGACCMFLTLPSSYTSAFAQGTVTNAVPVVPDVELVVSEDSIIDGTKVALDGFFERYNQFRNVTFEYGGGPFRLQNCKFDGPIRVSLKARLPTPSCFSNLCGLSKRDANHNLSFRENR